jgi:hypothetical protein
MPICAEAHVHYLQAEGCGRGPGEISLTAEPNQANVSLSGSLHATGHVASRLKRTVDLRNGKKSICLIESKNICSEITSEQQKNKTKNSFRGSKHSLYSMCEIAKYAENISKFCCGIRDSTFGRVRSDGGILQTVFHAPGNV